jgi:hypothetical protein
MLRYRCRLTAQTARTAKTAAPPYRDNLSKQSRPPDWLSWKCSIINSSWHTSHKGYPPSKSRAPSPTKASVPNYKPQHIKYSIVQISSRTHCVPLCCLPRICAKNETRPRTQHGHFSLLEWNFQMK